MQPASPAWTSGVGPGRTQGQSRTVVTQGHPGSGVQAAGLTLRQALQFPGHLCLRPSLPPADCTSCSASPHCSTSPFGWGRLRCGCWEQRMGGVTPAESHPREASEEPRWWLPPPATICRLAPGPEELVGRWGSGSDQPQPLLAPPIRATNAPRWPPWPCLLQPSPGAPRFPWTLRCLQGPLGQDLRWAAPLLPTHRTLGQGSGTALPPR